MAMADEFASKAVAADAEAVETAVEKGTANASAPERPIAAMKTRSLQPSQSQVVLAPSRTVMCPAMVESYMVQTVQPTSDTRETSRLISSEKVEGTSVENTRGDNLGHIEEIMIDK